MHRLTLRRFSPALLLGLPLSLMVAFSSVFAAEKIVTLPNPVIDVPLATQPGTTQTAAFAGGCFWGIQAVFQHIKGVRTAVSGYSGGTVKDATYQMVSSGSTGHAETVQVTYDPAVVSYGQLLKVFFSVAHDPTQLNRQGPDKGTQYRSATFYSSDEQKRVTQAYVAQLQAAKVFSQPIVTQVNPLTVFYRAESYHQDYATIHPDDPYIAYNDLPKVDNLRKEFPALYVPKPTLVGEAGK